MHILFTRFPLESAHGGAEVQSSSLMKGLKARGNITVDISWKNGKLDKLTLESETDETIKVTYGNLQKEISLLKNVPNTFNFELKKF